MGQMNMMSLARFSRAMLMSIGVAAFVSDAKCADLAGAPAQAETPAAAAFSWTGFYLGGYVGGSFGSNRFTLLAPNGRPIVNNSVNPGGLTFGGLLGFNYQIDQVVIGGEGEFGFDNSRATGPTQNTAGALRFNRSEEPFVGRVRGRVGFAFDKFLFYGAGGASFADNKVTAINPNSGVTQPLTLGLFGFNIGGGVEYSLTPNWIARVEYVYDEFGRKNYDFINVGPTFFNSRLSVLTKNTVRAAISYKF